MGFAHTRVADGEAALGKALSGEYRVAVVDLRMPKLDGIGFAQRYRESITGDGMLIVALTANASTDVKEACLAAGMDAFLAKPVRPHELAAMLRTAMERCDRV
jgi:two-component system sensor histidine kinase RpfC